MNKELITSEDPKSPIAEAFRTLRTNILFKESKKNIKTLLITSADEGEGKSIITANLAVAFAQTGKKTLLIDADMRKARQHHIFQVNYTPGLANYLMGVDEDNKKGNKKVSEYIQETQIENLFIMPAGRIPPRPSELLSNEKISSMIKGLRLTYDFILFDGTPSMLVTDSVLLSRVVDSTVIVVSYKSTKIESLKRIQRDIENVGGKIAGVVMNKVPVSEKKYSQYYRYYGNSLKKV